MVFLRSALKSVMIMVVSLYSICSFLVQQHLSRLIPSELKNAKTDLRSRFDTSKEYKDVASKRNVYDEEEPPPSNHLGHMEHKRAVNSPVYNDLGIVSNAVAAESLIRSRVGHANDTIGMADSGQSRSLNLPEAFPRWMRIYFNFHAKRRRQLNETNWKSQKYLILRCTHEDKKCGGLADRLKPLPYFLLLAARKKRLFMIRWDKPAKLEEFLLPNKMDWSVPTWMEQKIENDEVSRKHKHSAEELHNSKQATIIIEGKVQDRFGGADYYSAAVNETYEAVFHNMFRALFKPSPAVESIVKAKMEAANLVPGEYAVAHYRAFYAIEDRKHKRANIKLKNVALNAVNCGSELRPGGPIYFASDSKAAVDFVMAYAREGNRSIAVLEGDEALHLDKFDGKNRPPPSAFYSVFADLLLMAGGKCVTYGQGGFGSFALLLSNNATCTGRHFHRGNMQRCSWRDA